MMKKVLVTGANKGIGFEIARHLGKSGWQVIMGARSQERADNESLEISAAEIGRKHPDLSLLINNAGIPGDMEVMSYEADLADVTQTVQVNYIGTFCLTKALLPLLTKNKGRIVNITVPTEVSPYWHPMAYVASKAAQNVMTSIMAMEFEKKQIPVEIFDIHPGATCTDLNNHYSGPGSHQPDVIGEKVAAIINDDQRHQGEFLELYPIVDEGRD